MAIRYALFLRVTQTVVAVTIVGTPAFSNSILNMIGSRTRDLSHMATPPALREQQCHVLLQCLNHK
jgi:hypothetical protein